jgi:hypothetical protein
VCRKRDRPYHSVSIVEREGAIARAASAKSTTFHYDLFFVELQVASLHDFCANQHKICRA